MRSLKFLTLAFGMTLAFGCGESHDDGDPDAGITFDASFPDLPIVDEDGGVGGDVPTTSGDIGSTCGSEEMCASLCLGPDSGFRDGYCTQPCDESNMCPDGSTCLPVDRVTSYCFAGCDPDAERPCRAGYGCSNSPTFPPVCLPGCTDDTDCGGDLACAVGAGFSGAGECQDPNAMVGTACEATGECSEGLRCFSEDSSGWPGGACIDFGCDPNTSGTCPGDGICVPSGRGGGICLGGCAGADCRPGYECSDNPRDPSAPFCSPNCTENSHCTGGRVCNVGEGSCEEGFDPSELGTACSTVMGACAGGTCATEFASGFPGSYCVTIGCDPEAVDSGCPSGGVCADGASGAGVCFLGCEDSCVREGYACRPSDSEDPTSAMACLPGCATNDQCANEDFVCNPGTGRCRPAFDPDDLGAACADAAGCEGGSCVTDGYPGGMCVFPGCRLTGTGPSAMCPSGSICVDDDGGRPDLGICVTSCVAPADCRMGYACVAGACSPE